MSMFCDKKKWVLIWNKGLFLFRVWSIHTHLGINLGAYANTANACDIYANYLQTEMQMYRDN